MTCKDCIHSEVCYKKNDYENFPDRCGEFISDKVLEERPQGEWIRISAKAFKCKDCNYATDIKYPYCPVCGNKMVNDEFGNCSADLRGEEE